MNAYRPLNLVDSSAVVKIIRNSSSLAPALELQQWDSTLTTNVSWWDIATQSNELQFRDRKSGDVVRLMITATGQV